ncbi:hypothetical protein FB45DRAFT_870522 [Roridomyces roridus]|uniref:Zn(2)-C6 fungal-type domain-containing protein n=1 Tax=Roridomyces roridus TaxID=1738132 RepID=A0AAD7FIS3_9AGAR|nr:hypothetical protein FB45DRAFT_870522 [Roridomyces roridus]
MSQKGAHGASTRVFLPVLRKRVYVACTNCRRLKMRCDTTEESLDTPCERCARRGLRCQYLTVEEERSVSPTTPKHRRAPRSPPQQCQPHSGQHEKYPPQYDAGCGVQLHNSSQSVPLMPQYQYQAVSQCPGHHQPSIYPDADYSISPPAGHYASPPAQPVASGQYYEQAYGQTGYSQYRLGGYNTAGYAANTGRTNEG